MLIEVLLIAAATVLVAVAIIVAMRGRRSDEGQLIGRVAQLGETVTALQTGLAKSIEDLNARIGDSLRLQQGETTAAMGRLGERLVVIDTAQSRIAELAGQMNNLQDILTNKQARGAFGEFRLEELVRDVLAPDYYAFQATLSTGVRVDCLIRLARPPGPVAVDSKFPLENYRVLAAADDEAGRVLAARAFGADVRKHVDDIARKYIIAEETAEAAILFLPSEAIHIELLRNFREVIDYAQARRVYIATPTTLHAILIAMRALMKDVQMREQAGEIQKHVAGLGEDVRRLLDRVGNLDRHFAQARDDVDKIRTSADRISNRMERIRTVELAEPLAVPLIEPPAAAQTAPAPRSEAAD